MMRRRTLLVPALVAALVAAGAAASSSGVVALDGPAIVTVPAAVPPDATAVLANLTMVNGASQGYVTADACASLTDGPQAFSNGNHGAGSANANLAVVPVDADGGFCAYHQRDVDLLADVQGWVGAPGVDGLGLVPQAPDRRLDTRGASSSNPPAAGIVRVESGAPAGAVAVLANITMVDGASAGYVTAGPCTSLIDGPQAFSNGNHVSVTASSNLGVVAVDADGAFCVYRQRAVHLTVDVQGSFVAGAGLGIAITSPSRLIDTRGSSGSAAVPIAGSITRVDTGAPAGTEAALVNIAMVDGTGAGFVTADRCSTLVPGPQAFSTGNHLTGTATSNLAVVPLDADGSFCIFRQRAVHVTVDLQATFAAGAPDRLHLVEPHRVLDTRPPTPAVRTTSCAAAVHIGDSTSVGLVSSKILPDPADRVDAQYRVVGVGDPRMEISGARSIVERLPGQANAQEVAAAQRASGYHGCWVFALGTTDTANVAAGSSVSRRFRIDAMMQIAAGEPVLWVNVRTLETSGSWAEVHMQAWNAELQLATQRYPNLRVYDWWSAAQPAWFSADRVHYTPDGYRIRARLIAEALAEAFPA